jgi:hypothetical protein
MNAFITKLIKEMTLQEKIGQFCLVSPTAENGMNASGNRNRRGRIGRFPGNADPSDMASVNRPVLRVYDGKAQAVIRPFAKSGNITIRAVADGFQATELKIKVTK